MRRFRSSSVRLLAVLACFGLLPVLAAAQSDAFTLIVLPDTQHYSRSHPEIFLAQTEWIARNAAQENIRLVIGVGDLVDDAGIAVQWQNADTAVAVLDRAGVPYVLPIGNHDYDQRQPAGRSAASFNSYFGPARYAAAAHYGGSFPPGSNENFFSTFTFGGRAYLVLALEFVPRDGAVQWAESVLAAHRDKEVIVTTHSHVFSDDSHVGKCDPDSASTYKLQADNDGDELWEKFLQHHPNIVLVLSGHVTAGDGTGRLSQIGLYGNLVNQVLSNYQTMARGGNGYLRIMRVAPSLNRIEVSTYSPYLNAWLTDPENQFTLKYSHDTLGFAGAGYVTGRVRAHDCSKLAGVTVRVGDAAVETDTNGWYRLPVNAPAAALASAIHPAFHETGEPVTIHAGFDRQKDFWLSAAVPTGSIRGRVFTLNGTPISSAGVTIRGGNVPSTRALVSNLQGEFSAGTLPAGRYRVAVKVGKITRVQDVEVVAGAATPADFYVSTKYISQGAPGAPPSSPFIGRTKRAPGQRPRARMKSPGVAPPAPGSMMSRTGGSHEALPTPSAGRRMLSRGRRPGAAGNRAARGDRNLQH